MVRPISEADVERGRVGIELEMILRRDLFNSHTPLGAEFRKVFSQNGFTIKDDSTIVIHTMSKDIYYEPLETTNLELQGTMWLELKPRLTAILGWLRRRDYVWVDRQSRRVYATEEPPKEIPRGRLYRVELPRAKLPGNPSCGVHIHFHAEDWFDHFDHALAFAELWNYSMEFFREEANPARYVDGGDSYQATGEEFAHFVPLNIPNPEKLDMLRKDWEEKAPKDSEDSKNAFIVRHFLSWIKNHRWTAMNLTQVDVRKDIEFRFMHGTLNIETITHWVHLLVALIDAGRSGNLKDFKKYLSQNEPDILKGHDKRKEALANADLSRADVWKVDNNARQTSRAVRRLVFPAEGDSYGFSSSL